ncbi:MAG: metallophosphoesterase [Candidatus Omnitrophota bacterium]
MISKAARKKLILSVFIGIGLLFTFQLSAAIDHIHFGSKGNPLQGLTVTWRGNYNKCSIKWGYTSSYEKGNAELDGRTEFGDKHSYLFDYTFPDPEPSKTIHYAFKEYNGPYECEKYSGDWTQDYTFQTSTDVQSDHFTFIAGGDSRGESCESRMPGWQAVTERLGTTTADFYLCGGDLMIEGGNKQKWLDWYENGQRFLSQKLIYFSIGNHERYADPNVFNYLNQFTVPENGNFSELYYSFEFGNAVFISLSTEISSKTDKGKAFIDQETQWLTAQLKKYRGAEATHYKEWVIVTFHKPFFTIDKHMGEMTARIPSDETSDDYSKIWWKDLFDAYGVDVIINGHTHAYMRSIPLCLTGTGPGGTDITFNDKGLWTEKPVKSVEYGNKKGQGRLEVVAGGFGVNLLTEDKLPYKNEWFVNNYTLEFHYCEFKIDKNVLTMTAKRISDDRVIDQVTIKH